MRDCDPLSPPELDDLYFERPIELARAYRVVGLEETADPTVWRLVLERMKWGEFLTESEFSERVRGFHRDSPRPRLRSV